MYQNADDINPKEEIEGIEEGQDISLGEYPIDTVLIREDKKSVFELLRRISNGDFILNPDFQRDFIWTEEKQSKFIESVLMRIPLPVLYFAENNDGKMIVVDGVQRLTTFKRYLNNEFALKIKTKPGEKESELNNKKFSDLTPKLKNRIEDCGLIVYSIDSKVPEIARLDIFERVNSGVPLTRQQMRNCLYMGKATMFLKQEASSDIFRQATGQSLSSKSMRDREFVNRFCAFEIIPLKEYKGDMDLFLADCLKRMNIMDDEKLSGLSDRFRLSMRNNLIIFGDYAFRKHTTDTKSRNVLNASLWDVFSTKLSHYSEYQVQGKKDLIHEKFYQLMEDQDFNDSISIGTNDQKKVFRRFEKVDSMLKEVFHA